MSRQSELAQLGRVFDTSALSNRNFIINGSMQVAQRGTSFSYNSFGGAAFSVDRFWFYNGGGATSGTIEQSTDVPSGQGLMYSLFNNTNANLPSGTNVELTKQGNAAPFVVGNTYTISFWVKGTSSYSSTLQISWRNSHANGTNSVQAVASYPTFNVTTSWTRVVVTFTLNASPVSTNNVLDFEYGHPAGGKITGFQLEAGDTATPFEHRSYGQELALCQRYFQAHGDVNFQGWNHNIADTGGTRTQAYSFPVAMRAVPSITYRDNVDNAQRIYAEYPNSTNGNNITFNFYATTSAIMGFKYPYGNLYGSNGDSYMISANDLYLDAEL